MLKSTVSGNGPLSELTWLIAHRSEPALLSSRVSVTVNVDGSVRSSRGSNTGRRLRRRPRRKVEGENRGNRACCVRGDVRRMMLLVG
jgi:hypothetical protein